MANHEKLQELVSIMTAAQSKAPWNVNMGSWRGLIRVEDLPSSQRLRLREAGVEDEYLMAGNTCDTSLCAAGYAVDTHNPKWVLDGRLTKEFVAKYPRVRILEMMSLLEAEPEDTPESVKSGWYNLSEQSQIILRELGYKPGDVVETEARGRRLLGLSVSEANRLFYADDFGTFLDVAENILRGVEDDD